MLAYRIDNMTCGHCVSTIARAVREVDPGAKLDVDLVQHLLRIEPSSADAGEFNEAITEAGYTPVLVPVAPREALPTGRGACCGCRSARA